MYSPAVDKTTIELILARKEQPLDNSGDLAVLSKARVLITGGLGSLGQEVTKTFEAAGIDFLSTDVEDCDVTNRAQLFGRVEGYKPTHIMHLAADKHAPEGELYPEATFSINTVGTLNVFEAAAKVGAVVTLASTCKSCDPETVYGSSKLIAERITLNNGGTVARFYNVVNTAGNVYEIWGSQASDSKIEVADCNRYFISALEAQSLLIRCVALSSSSPGRYIFEPGISHFMPDIAKRLYSSRELVHIPPRRGDRRVEPLKATSEKMIPVVERLMRVESPHDPLIG